MSFIPYTPLESLQNIQKVFINTFGTNVNLFPSSINGVLIQELTNQNIQANNAQTLIYSSLYNPNVAPYPFIDAIAEFDSITRIPAIPSTVFCMITGLPGTIIPAGSVIYSPNGDSFNNLDIITISSSGSINVTFTQVTNPNVYIVPVPAGTYTIGQQISGWDTVTYISSIVGSPVQNDYDFRNTRRLSLGLNSTGSYLSVIAVLEESTLVQYYYVYNNNTSTPFTFKGVTINPYTLYITLYPTLSATDSMTVAGLIAQKISAGCGMQGSTTVNYVPDKYPWVIIPIQWDTPIPTPIQVNVNILNSPTYPQNISVSIQNGIVDNFKNGTATIPGVIMGVPFYVERFSEVLTGLGVSQIISITMQVGIGSTGTIMNPIDLNITEVATLIPNNVVLTIS